MKLMAMALASAFVLSNSCAFAHTINTPQRMADADLPELFRHQMDVCFRPASD
jgi:hypothetical protein